jgi:carboxyl-terminal processing protease
MRRAAGIAAVLFLLAGAFWLGLLLTRSPGVITTPVVRGLGDVDRSPLAIDEVREELSESYYRSVGSTVLGEDSIPEMIEALGDPHTDYLTPAEYDALKHRTARSYSGVGLTVEPVRAGLLVTSALKGPARAAGIRSGDVIVRIDGRPTGGLTFERSLTLMKGERGSIVNLTVRRRQEGRLRFTVVRREIALPSLRARLLERRGTRIGYLRLLSFPEASAERIDNAVARLVERGAQGIVLDLRDNPGGLLGQAIQTASVFLEEGVVCTTAGVNQDERVYEVTGRATHPDLPLVLLLNRGSASASEILAAALGEHERSVLVGRRTYGKASVQSIRPLSNGAALKLTTATYLTPSGFDLTGVGIRPHVRAVDDPLTRTDEALRAAQRALLQQIA